MAHYVITELRIVKAQGLKKGYIPAENKLRELIVDHDWKKLGLLSLTSPNYLFCAGDKSKPIIFYPGCGQDILYLLLFLEKIGYSFSEAYFIFNDTDNVLGLIKTVLDDAGIWFVEEKIAWYGENISFYWREQLIHLRFVQGNVFELLPHLSFFDLYFERAFRLMKEEHPEYESLVFRKLNPVGVLISDSGYSRLPLKRIEINPAVSSYGEMIVGVKNK